MSKIFGLFKHDESRWHFFTVWPWRKLPDGLGSNPMRRKIDGAWEYRASTDEEAEEEFLSRQW